MTFDYFEALSGEPLLISGVGYIRSPKVKDLFPKSGIGHLAYDLYISFLLWDKKGMLEYAKLSGYKKTDKFKGNNIGVYDVVSLVKETTALGCVVLDFFITGNVRWDDKTMTFVVDNHANGLPNGVINKSNFEAVRAAILQLNFIGLDKIVSVNKPKFQDENAKRAWERAQEFLKKQSKPSKSDDGRDIGNIVSKLSAIHPTYNIFNIRNLTVFQLYDAYFQASYMRGVNLSEMIFSNHGGEKFKFDDWERPVVQ